MYRQYRLSMRPRQMRLLRLSTHSRRSLIFFVSAGSGSERGSGQPSQQTKELTMRK